MESPQTFVEEIDYYQLEFLEVVGKGAFGVVSRARWRNKEVAVKLIETESEKKAFITELKQLSRVQHPNIVRLYGACTRHPVCLVMEYAEGGSLYNVLHGRAPQPDYTTSHALSWALQCALGVEYLHNMKPKALIHRDLKPPNLLLIMGGTVLKICDFGTACDQQTHMTNNKGSAAWMAPEVFEGCSYTEKCDVFSWGIILWEVLTRRKPFDDIGGPAFRIMWAVHSGTRPPPIQNLPTPLEKLMDSCWLKSTMQRPSMSEIVRVMKGFMPYYRGHTEPLVYPSQFATQREDPEDTEFSEHPATMTSQRTSPPVNSIKDTIRQALDQSKQLPGPRQPTQPVVIEEDIRSNLRSAPASLAASRENLFDMGRSPRSATPIFDQYKRYSADLSKLDGADIMAQSSQHMINRKLGHRRSGSYGTTVTMGTIDTLPQHVMPTPPARTHRRVGSDEYSRLVLTNPLTNPYATHMSTTHTTLANRSTSWTPGVAVNFTSDQVPNLDALNAILDSQLQPIAPSPSNPQSLAIFEQHCRVATDYLKVQIEIALLSQRKQEINEQCEKDEQSEQYNIKMADEFKKLQLENENLRLWHSDLKHKLNKSRSQSMTS